MVKDKQTTRFDDCESRTHPFGRWWREHGQYMMAGGGRREMIWAFRGWIAREQYLQRVKVTGEVNGDKDYHG